MGIAFEENDLEKKNEKIQKNIQKKLVSEDEFLNNRKRYCLWLVDCPPDELKKCLWLLKR